MDLAGTNILVTGASSGIGAALAPQLAAERRDRRHRGAPGRSAGVGARTMSGAFAKLRDVGRRLVRSRRGHHGCRRTRRAFRSRRRARQQRRDREAQARADPDRRRPRHDDAHQLHSPIRMAMALLPSMIERGSGLIVNVSSMGGRLGIAHEAAYSASKFAMCGWSESARMDLDGTGVKVKLVLPGPDRDRDLGAPTRRTPRHVRRSVRDGGDCAADIVRDRRSRRLRVLHARGGARRLAQKDLVVGKTQNCDQFLTGMAQMAAAR